MKKLLFLTIALTMFASCQKGGEPNADNPTLVSGIVMPTGEFKTNDSVIIKGEGFLKGDAISLRAAVKSSDISAVVTEVTESQLVFIVPRGVVAGKMNVVLKRDVREQILGEVTIASRPPAKIYGLSVTPTDLYEIDPATGIATHMLTFADGYKLVNPLAIGHTMYATGHRGDGNWSNHYIVSYNLDTKELKKVSDKISNQHAYDALGVIDGKLHVLAVVDDIVKLISIDSVTNAKTEVADFGKLDNPICVNGWTTSAGGFAYDAKNNKIIIEGFWDGIQANPRTDTYHKTVVLDLSNNTIEYLDIIDDYRNPAYYLTKGSRICSIHHSRVNGYLNLLDDKYQIESQLVSVANPSSMFTYDAVEDMMYVYVSNGWCSVDLKTTPATSNTVKGALQPIQELFVVR